MRNLKAILELTKWRVSLAVTFTAVIACLAVSPAPGIELLKVVLGVFLMSSAASALNQYQDRRLDARMQRTSTRPLPDNRMTGGVALVIVALLAVSGFVVLFSIDPLCGWLGLCNMALYNGVYTYFKRITFFALLPGSLVGAVPAIIGWVGGGGIIHDGRLLVICFFLFLWQIPHFWFLLYRYHQDYRNAGFTSVISTVEIPSFKRIVFAWIAATSVSTMFFTQAGIITQWYITLVLIVFNAVMILSFARIIFGTPGEINYALASQQINLYMVAVMLLILINAWI